MKRLIILCVSFLILAYGVSLGVQSAEAATYVSLLTSSNNEAAWLECVYSLEADSYWHYDYTIHLQDFGSYVLPGTYTYYDYLATLKVMNASGGPVEMVQEPSSPDWDFVQPTDHAYYKWTAASGSDYFNQSAGSLNAMEVRSIYEPVLVDAAVWDGGLPTSAGQTMGPAPEPASIALLGFGLIGLAGGVIRKRFKA